MPFLRKQAVRKQIERASVRGAFLTKKKTNRQNRIRIESARVSGSKKDGRDVFLAFSSSWLRTQLIELTWAGHSTRREHRHDGIIYWEFILPI